MNDSSSRVVDPPPLPSDRETLARRAGDDEVGRGVNDFFEGLVIGHISKVWQAIQGSPAISHNGVALRINFRNARTFPAERLKSKVSGSNAVAKGYVSHGLVVILVSGLW
jgi:hypothetical protein